MSINLTLSLEEVQLIANALGNLPFGQVEALVNNIRTQVVPQMKPAPAAPDEEGTQN